MSSGIAKSSLKLAARIWVVGLLALASPELFANEVAVKKAVLQFCSRIGVPVSQQAMTVEKKVSKRSGTVSWRIMQGESMFSVDDESMEVTMFADLREASNCRVVTSGALPGKFRNQKIAVAKAYQILQILSPGHKMVLDKFTMRGEQSKFQNLPRENSVAVVMKEPDSNGRPQPVGNMLEVIMNGGTGKLISVSIQRHWKYDPKKVVLSKNQAIERAKQILTSIEPGLISGSPTVNGQYMIPISGFGCTVAERFKKEKRARYAYCVEFQKVFIFIDAEDGKSLGGKRMARL